MCVEGGGGRVCQMKVVSWNVRRLGGSEKRKEVRDLVREKVSCVVCIQETKLQSCDDFMCSSIWGSQPHAYFFRPSVGASGGLLTIWDTSEVEVCFSASGDHYLLIHGKFIKSNEEFYMFNMYAPCDPRAKQVLWNSLSSRLQLLG